MVVTVKNCPPAVPIKKLCVRYDQLPPIIVKSETLHFNEHCQSAFDVYEMNEGCKMADLPVERRKVAKGSCAQQWIEEQDRVVSRK